MLRHIDLLYYDMCYAHAVNRGIHYMHLLNYSALLYVMYSLMLLYNCVLLSHVNILYCTLLYMSYYKSLVYHRTPWVLYSCPMYSNIT